MSDVNVFKNVSELKIDLEMTVSELLQKLKLVTSSDSKEVFVNFVSTTHNFKKKQSRLWNWKSHFNFCSVNFIYSTRFSSQ